MLQIYLKKTLIYFPRIEAMYFDTYLQQKETYVIFLQHTVKNKIYSADKMLQTY